MARIDALIHHLFEFNADTLGIAAGHPVVLVTNGQQRPITAASIAAAQVELLVNEIVPAEARQRVGDGAEHAYPYASPSGTVKAVLRKTPAGFQLGISRAVGETAAAPSAPAAKPAAARPPEPSTKAPAAPAAAAPQPTPGLSTSSSQQQNIKNALDPYFYQMMEKGASDLYICSYKPPIIRKDGDLVSLNNEGPMNEDRVKELLYSITPTEFRERFEENNDADFAYEVKGLARFRCNLFVDRMGPAGIFRQIPSKIPSAEDLGLPKPLLDLCTLNKGLVLVTGPTGSGKSTTLAAMIDYINRNRSSHIITIEDPIEFVHQDKKCVVNQREVHNHTKGFKTALRAALREDPDIVLVGEMRDLETVEIAIETAETGHLVFGTLHTNTAPSTVDRVIDQFPADRQAQVRTMLSEALKGVVAQTLCKKKGGGRIAALEILIVTVSVSNLIREGKTFQIPSIMQTGRSLGMQSLNDALMKLVEQGSVDAEQAYQKAVDRGGFRNMLKQRGIDVE